MKRLLFIIGIVLIVVLTTIWVYLLFFSNSTNGNGVFNLFDFGDTTDPTAEDITTGEAVAPLVDTTGTEALRQLTTKPVAGFTEVQETASSSPLIYFVEAGTGHVFTINLSSGEENRISNITVPMAQKAEISPDGNYVAIKSGEGRGGSLQVISLEGGTPSTTELEDASDTFSMSGNVELLYTVQTTMSTVGKAYNFESKTSKTVFEIPLREVVVLWGNTTKDTHYFYPKTASRLEGALYSLTNGVMNRLPISGYGLAAAAKGDYVLYSKQTDNTYKTFVYNVAEKYTHALDVPFLAEKCAFTKTYAHGFCANAEGGTFNLSTPDTWYQGILSYNDDLWRIDLEAGYTELLTKPLQTIGRELDVVYPEFGIDNRRIYFTNKNDNTLWLFDSNVTE